jgi:alkylation response protein AidB-like acyl-CoA dehydrogenase
VIARGAITALVELAAAKTPTGGRRPLRERPLAYVAVADAETTLEAARALLYRCVDDIWQTVLRDEEPSLRQRALLRLAGANAATAAVAVVDAMHAAAGATSNFVDSPLQRSLRDVQAARGHILIARGVVDTAGRILVGLDADTTMF